jgi:hypothetical protein
MSFQLSKIIVPQFVALAATALQLTVDAAGTQAAAVPALTSLSLWTARFINVTNAPVTLKVYRGAATAANTVINTITIPVATANNPYFEWSPGYQLAAGDSIVAIAGTASAIVVTGDGGITT